MPTPISLPPGYGQRPLTTDDVAGATAVIAAAELLDVGEVIVEEADLVAEWHKPTTDLERDSIGVTHDSRLVACADLINDWRAIAAVHPEHRGLGIGTAIAGWIADRAGERGNEVIGMSVPAGSPGDELLAGLGWFIRWESWVLELPPGATIPERPLPAAYRLGEAAPDRYRELQTVIEDAFLEWSERARQPYDDWAAEVVRRPGFEPWQLRAVHDAADEVVAAAVLTMSEDGTEGWVSQLATRKDQRGRGLAQALLADTFAAARTHGATRSSLSTDSRTGALSLYEKVGMRVSSTFVHRATRPLQNR